MPPSYALRYGDKEGYDRTAQSVRDAAHANDESLVQRGALVGMAGAAVQVRNPDDKAIDTQPGPFMSSALPIAGFAIIEADDLSEAIKLVAQSPSAVAHGVVDVWPLRDS